MKPLSILIAEDEALVRADLKEMLERNGHKVCGETNNGYKVVDLAKLHIPDLAILDVMMPGLDGIEAARILHTLNIPVVLVTAYNQPHIISRAENVHVSGYLVKPISEQNLLAAVRIAYARWKDIQNMQCQLAEAKDLLNQQKLIAKAKVILVDRKKVSEHEAHRNLVQEAMKRRISLVELAREIIGTQE